MPHPEAVPGVSVDRLVGNTPLIALRSLSRDCPGGVEILAKAEWANPGGSVKDRPALRILRRAEEAGRLRPGVTVLDATSGNTGIAYAWIGAARGWRVKLCMPGGVTRERQKILNALGAELVLTSPMEGSDGAIREARRLAAAEPDLYFYADQYGNDDNWRSHLEGTGPEIVQQTAGTITHFVATLGTSGTFVGVGRHLRQVLPHVRLISAQPDSPFHGLEGLKHMASAIVPRIYDPGLADENLEIGTEEAYRMVRRLARDEGLLVGGAAGAAAVAALEVARRLASGVVVTIFPDSGFKYLSERFWDET
jgi:cysteine synthase B